MAGITVADLRVEFSADPGPAVRAIDTVNRKIEDSERAMQAFGGALLGISGAAAAGFVKAIGTTMDFDKQLSAIASVGGKDAQMQLEAIRTTALQLGADTAFSASEAAAGMEEMIKAGLSVEDVLGGAAQSVLDLSAASATPVEESARIMSSVLNVFSDTMTGFETEGEKATHIADLLAQAANASATDVHGLGYAFQASGAIARGYNVTVEDLTTSLAILAQNGMQSSDMGTSLKSMFLSLSRETKPAADALQELGLTFEDFQDSAGEFIGTEELFAMLRTQADAVGISGMDLNRIFNKLFGSDAGRAAQIFFRTTEEGWDSMRAGMANAGTAVDQAAERQNNLAGDVEKLTGSIEGMVIAFTSFTQGPLRGLVQGLTEVVNWFTFLPPQIQQTMVILGAVGTVVAGVVGGWLLFGKQIKLAITGMKLFGVAAKGMLLSPLGLVIAALAGLGLAYKENFLGFQDFVDFQAGRIGQALSGVGDFVDDVRESFETLTQKGMEPFKAGVLAVSAVLSGAFGRENPVSTALRGLARFFDDAREAGEKFGRIFALLTNDGMNPFEAAARSLYGVLRDVFNLPKDSFLTDLLVTFASLGHQLGNNLIPLFARFGGIVGAVADGFRAGGIGGAIQAFIGRIPDIASLYGDILGMGVRFVGWILDGIKQKAPEVWSWFTTDFIQGMSDGLMGMFNDAGRALYFPFLRLKDALRDLWSEHIEPWLLEVPAMVSEAIGNIEGWIMTVGAPSLSLWTINFQSWIRGKVYGTDGESGAASPLELQIDAWNLALGTPTTDLTAQDVIDWIDAAITGFIGIDVELLTWKLELANPDNDLTVLDVIGWIDAFLEGLIGIDVELQDWKLELANPEFDLTVLDIIGWIDNEIEQFTGIDVELQDWNLKLGKPSMIFDPGGALESQRGPATQEPLGAPTLDWVPDFLRPTSASAAGLDEAPATGADQGADLTAQLVAQTVAAVTAASTDQTLLNSLAAFSGGITTYIAAGVATATDQWTAFETNIKTNVTGAITAITTDQTVLDQITGIGTTVAQNAGLGIGDHTINFKLAVHAMADAGIQMGVQTATGGAPNIGIAVVTNAGIKMGEHVTGLAEAIKAVVGAAMLQAEAYAEEQAAFIGGAIVTGAAIGVTVAAPVLDEAVKGMVGGAIGTAETELDAHSPSRKFRALGYTAPQGFALGIKDGTGDVERAMNGLWEGVSLDKGQDDRFGFNQIERDLIKMAKDADQLENIMQTLTEEPGRDLRWHKGGIVDQWGNALFEDFSMYGKEGFVKDAGYDARMADVRRQLGESGQQASDAFDEGLSGRRGGGRGSMDERWQRLLDWKSSRQGSGGGIVASMGDVGSSAGQAFGTNFTETAQQSMSSFTQSAQKATNAGWNDSAVVITDKLEQFVAEHADFIADTHNLTEDQERAIRGYLEAMTTGLSVAPRLAGQIADEFSAEVEKDIFRRGTFYGFGHQGDAFREAYGIAGHDAAAEFETEYQRQLHIAVPQLAEKSGQSAGQSFGSSFTQAAGESMGSISMPTNLMDQIPLSEVYDINSAYSQAFKNIPDGGEGSLTSYFAHILGDGDYLNDALVEMNKPTRDVARIVGEDMADGTFTGWQHYIDQYGTKMISPMMSAFEGAQGIFADLGASLGTSLGTSFNQSLGSTMQVPSMDTGTSQHIAGIVRGGGTVESSGEGIIRASAGRSGAYASSGDSSAYSPSGLSRDGSDDPVVQELRQSSSDRNRVADSVSKASQELVSTAREMKQSVDRFANGEGFSFTFMLDGQEITANVQARLARSLGKSFENVKPAGRGV